MTEEKLSEDEKLQKKTKELDELCNALSDEIKERGVSNRRALVEQRKAYRQQQDDAEWRLRELQKDARDTASKVSIDDERNPDGTFKPGHSHLITTQTAKDLQRKSVIARKAKKVENARAALLKEVRAVAPPDYDIETWEDAWGLFTGIIASRGIDQHTKLRDAIKAYHALGKATDAFPDKTPLSVRDGQQSVSGDPDMVLQLLMEARASKDAE